VKIKIQQEKPSNSDGRCGISHEQKTKQRDGHRSSRIIGGNRVVAANPPRREHIDNSNRGDPPHCGDGRADADGGCTLKIASNPHAGVAEVNRATIGADSALRGTPNTSG
jgi:hypothetical protein